MPTPENLVLRAQALRRIRAFFDARGFVEVETPVRIPAPAPSRTSTARRAAAGSCVPPPNSR